jgi:hypothetical protein
MPMELALLALIEFHFSLTMGLGFQSEEGVLTALKATGISREGLHQLSIVLRGEGRTQEQKLCDILRNIGSIAASTYRDRCTSPASFPQQARKAPRLAHRAEGHICLLFWIISAAVLGICSPLNTFFVISAEGTNEEQEGEVINDEMRRRDSLSRTVSEASLSNAGDPGIARDDEDPTLLELARDLPSFKKYLPSIPAATIDEPTQVRFTIKLLREFYLLPPNLANSFPLDMDFASPRGHHRHIEECLDDIYFDHLDKNPALLAAVVNATARACDLAIASFLRKKVRWLHEDCAPAAVQARIHVEPSAATVNHFAHIVHKYWEEQMPEVERFFKQPKYFPADEVFERLSSHMLRLLYIVRSVEYLFA